MAFALTQEDLAKNLLDKEGTRYIEQHMYNPREQERINRGDVAEEGLGGPVGDQAFLGDLWNNLKEKYKENQNWEPTYPTEPENLKQRRLEKEYPDLRKEPQEFSQKDVNKKVAEVVGQTAQKIVEDNPGLAGLENDYIADGTNGRMAQQVFERPDADRSISDEEFIDLLKRLGVDSSPWENDTPSWATDGRTWKT